MHRYTPQGLGRLFAGPLLTLPGLDTAARRTKSFPRQTWAFLVDGFAIVVGALMGIAPLTVYIESATGKTTVLALALAAHAA